MSNKATLTELIQRSFIEMMKDVGTSIPGNILAYDPDTQLAQLQIGIQRVDVNGVTFTPPPLIECPVYVYGGDFTVETQIDPGTEGIIFFSQRCIDAWNDTGGVANIPILRFHDFSDAYFLPGMRSQPNVVSGHANNGIRLRNKAGDKYIWLKNDGTADITVDTLNINADIIHNGNTTQIGDVTLTGNITQTGNMILTGNITQEGVFTLTGAMTATGVITAPTLIGTVNVIFGGIAGFGHVHISASPGNPSGPAKNP